MKIFVLHYSKLVDRKKHILEQFKKQNITDYEFIEKYDKEDLQDCDILLFDTCVKKSMMSLMNKHFYVYKLIAENYENALILEDDVILHHNFTNILNKYIIQLPEDYDMLFIGDGCNLHIENNKLISNQNIYEKCLYPTRWGGDGASRCSDSYIISKKCANKLCEYINNLTCKINLPSDWWLNVAARNNNLKVYWSEPTIVTQGTQNGLFKSSH
jgi:GR25 family glycosyltransferase involved in LPS biosynthesis